LSRRRSVAGPPAPARNGEHEHRAEHERDRVQAKRHLRDVTFGQVSSEYRRDDRGQDAQPLHHRVGGDQMVWPDQRGQQRVAGRGEHGREAAHDGQRQERAPPPQRGEGLNQIHEPEHDPGPDQVCQDHQGPARQPVRQRAADRAEQNERHEEHEGHPRD
jgi:hypothetical protein